MKKIILGLISLVLLFGFVSVVKAYTFPSTNELNKTKQVPGRIGQDAPYINQDSVGVGEVTLEFVNDSNSLAFFEYRIDGIALTSGTAHPVVIGDYIYPGVCVDGRVSPVCGDGSPEFKTFYANEYVEVRLALGGERDWDFDWTRFDVLYNRTAEITSPGPGEEVSGLVDFTAYLNDDDADGIQWAVREGTCAAGTNTVFGNVDGHSDVATIDTSDLANQTFSFSADMSSMTLGMYCFIYNPAEDNGEAGIRKTVEFTLVEPPVGPPTNKNECKKDGWMTFNNPFFKNQGDCVSWIQSNENAVGNRKDN
jgi:hypothetical protein